MCFDMVKTCTVCISFRSNFPLKGDFSGLCESVQVKSCVSELNEPSQRHRHRLKGFFVCVWISVCVCVIDSQRTLFVIEATYLGSVQPPSPNNTHWVISLWNVWGPCGWWLVGWQSLQDPLLSLKRRYGKPALQQLKLNPVWGNLRNMTLMTLMWT